LAACCITRLGSRNFEQGFRLKSAVIRLREHSGKVACATFRSPPALSGSILIGGSHMKSACAVLLSLGLLSVIYGGGRVALMAHSHQTAIASLE
jgi:hypothetical protein